MEHVEINNNQIKTSHSINTHPELCPWCHHGIQPILKSGFVEDPYLYLLYSCPRKACKKGFIGYYQRELVSSSAVPFYSFASVSLGEHQRRDFQEIIKKLSPQFVEIYNQALEAEQRKLDQIAGLGYRKSLEFLIKDYIISRHPDKADETKDKWLGRCITDDVEDAKVKATAERATWLGNDEAHYIRVWVDKDVTDLKMLIDLTLNWIEAERLTADLIKSMPNKK